MDRSTLLDASVPIAQKAEESVTSGPSGHTTRRTRESPSRRAMECPAYGVNRLTKMLDGPPPSVEPNPDRNSLPSFARPM